MLTLTKSVSIAGNISLDTDNIISLNASIPESGTISIYKNILNKSEYLKNKTECDEEIKKFEDIVNNYI